MKPWRAEILLGTLGFGTLPLLAATTVPGFTWLIVLIVFTTVVFAFALSDLARRVPSILPTFLLLASAFAVFSLLTGVLNGLSDEPYSTPAYASLGLGMYQHPVSFAYVEYGRALSEHSYNVYLPGLTFVQIPGLDYRWVAFAAWLSVGYLLRTDAFALGGWSTPWIATLAANGQNDFVPLLALTLALVIRPRGRWVWEILSLGLKQFANVIAFSYHLVRREYLLAAGTIAVTVAILAPFLYLDPAAVWCHVVVGSPTTTCVSHSWTFFVFKRNYWLYPTWLAIAFHRPLAEFFARRWSPFIRFMNWARFAQDKTAVSGVRP